MDAADSRDQTALVWAGRNGHVDVVLALIAAGNKQAIKIISGP